MDQRESSFSSESSYARPVFATPKEEVETGNVKLETSVENKPRYAVPSVSVKAEEKPTVSVKKQHVNLWERYGDDPSTHPDFDPDLWIETGSFSGPHRNLVNELSNTTAKNLQAAHSISTAGSSQSVSNTQYQELVVLQQYTAHLTEKYKRLLADYKQHMAYFTEKHDQLSVNYEELRANYEQQQLRANDEQLRVNYEQQQFRANYEQLRQIIMNITSQKNASGNKKEEPDKAEVGSSN